MKGKNYSARSDSKNDWLNLSGFNARTSLICCLAVTFLCNMAMAGIGISPMLKEVRLGRGGWTDFKIVVSNSEKDTMLVQMLADNMDMSAEGTAILAVGDYKRGCADWVAFTPPEFTLAPGNSLEVKASVKAPKDAVGSYFAMLSAQRKQPVSLSAAAQREAQAGIDILIRITSLLMVTINSSKNVLQFGSDTLEFHPRKIGDKQSPTVSEGITKDAWQVKVPVCNDGNVYTLISGDVSIYTESGRMIDRAPLFAGRGFIIPDRKRIFEANGQRPLMDGVYLVRANIRSREGKSRSGTFSYTVYEGAAYEGSNSVQMHSLVKSSMPQFGFSDRYLNFQVSPKGSSFKGFTVTNFSQDTLSLQTRLVNWIVNEKGETTLSDKDVLSNSTSCKTWIKVDPMAIKLMPNQKQNIKINVVAPDEVEGEYYAGICYDASPSDASVPTDFQLPRTVFVEASNKKTAKPSAEIISVVATTINANGGCIFEVTMKNTGNMHCYEKGRVTVIDDKGKIVGDAVDFGNEAEYVFPGVMKIIQIPYQAILEPGIYQVETSLAYYENQKPVRIITSFEVKK